MKNEELIKALRCCIVDFNSTQSRLCNECPYRIYADGKKACENKAKRDAADILKQTDAVKHGKWQWLSSTYDRTPCEMKFRCSICHHEVIRHNAEPWEHYCPQCGAKMDGEEKEDETRENMG